MKSFAKKTFYTSLRSTGLHTLARWANRRNALILRYQCVLKSAEEIYPNRSCVSAEMFETQMRWLKRNYKVLPLKEVVAGVSGLRPLPDCAAAITFDGGFRNTYTDAFPLLMKHDLPATVFLATDFIGGEGKKMWTEHVDTIVYNATCRRLSLQMNGSLAVFDVSNPDGKIAASDRIRGYLKSLNPRERDRRIISLERQVDREGNWFDQKGERYAFMNWNEVRLMAEAGIHFGSHSASHPILATLPPDELAHELTTSRDRIRAELGTACPFFSYPNGRPQDYSLREQQALQDAGYEAAFALDHCMNRTGENPFGLHRINISRSNCLGYFLAKITGVQHFLKERAHAA